MNNPTRHRTCSDYQNQTVPLIPLTQICNLPYPCMYGTTYRHAAICVLRDVPPIWVKALHGRASGTVTLQWSSPHGESGAPGRPVCSVIGNLTDQTRQSLWEHWIAVHQRAATERSSGLCFTQNFYPDSTTAHFRRISIQPKFKLVWCFGIPTRLRLKLMRHFSHPTQLWFNSGAS